MATPPRGLVLVLIGMEAWLAAPIRTGSPRSGWWGTQEASQLRQTARRYTLKGDYAETERAYQKAADLAAKHRDPAARAWSVSGIGDARFARFDYMGALDAYLEARKFAETARDPVSLGAIDLDLASLYQQMWDRDSALQFAEEAREITQRASGIYYRAQLYLLLAQLRSDKSSPALYREAIEAARTASARDAAQAGAEAIAWEHLGDALLADGDLDGAQAAYQSALSIRQSRAQRDLGYSYGALGAVRLKEAERTEAGPSRRKLLAEAQDLTDRAMRTTVAQRYLLQYQQGQILLAQGRVRAGLEAMESAIQESEEWRTGIAPAASSADGVAAAHQTKVFDGFIQAAADYGIRARNQRWVEESLEASELNRAINLRDSSAARLRNRLPVEYWEALGKLQAEEAQNPPLRQIAVASRLKLKLTELESKVELGNTANIAENFPSHDSLNHFRRSLRDSELFLSFSLGDPESFVWAVTRNTLNVYRLPAAERIVSVIREFRRLVEAGTAGAGANQGFEDLGQHLYNMLFGQLSLPEASKRVWLLSAEDALLELPFGALVLEPKDGSGHMVFLAERHSLEIKAGALLTGRPLARPGGGLVLVGDPIYNRADGRFDNNADRGSGHAPPEGTGRSWFAKTGFSTGWAANTWFDWTGSEVSGQLNRLPGSHQEVEASAAAWTGTPTLILEGASATRENFLKALIPTPQVIHLATHAVTLEPGDDADLVFSLGRDGRPELLSTFQVRTLDVPGSVVVMTGCATAPSDVKAGLGMAGLVRAWTVAGAKAVVATEWAVQDSTGSALLGSFYRHLRNEMESGVAEALRAAQTDMIHSGTNDAEPAVWAAYQVFGGQTGVWSEQR